MENKQPSFSPAGERENIMGTMDINPLLIKLSVPMMVSMLVQALYNVGTRSSCPTSARAP